LQKELAEQLEVEPITVARLIDRLESRGMVERRPDPADRRCWRLHLTGASRPLLGEIGVHLDDVARILCADLPPATLEGVSAAILQMRDRAQEQRNAPLENPAEPFEELA
jgi:DNA-binding MarR family transcriptional regulator